MTVLDSVEVWFRSLRPLLERADVVVRFYRSDAVRPNPSCGVVLGYKDAEADLIVWESGEGELVLVDRCGEVVMEHFDNLAEIDPLVDVLQRVLKIVPHIWFVSMMRIAQASELDPGDYVLADE